MDSSGFDALSDNDIWQRLGDGEFVYGFETSYEWKLFREACLRVARQAQVELLDVPADHTVRIIELQQLIKLYSRVPQSLMNSFKQEGIAAFEEAKDRGLINRN